MARPPRLAVAGLPHLVALYGRGDLATFADDADRLAFLSALHESARQHQVALHAYVLAADHVHLLLTPPSAAALSASIQGLGRRYVAGLNRRHARRGSPWVGRFRATVVQPGPPLLEALLFIDLHAVRQGAALLPAEAPFSSARHHLGLARDPLLSAASAYWQLGNTPFEREAAYRRHLDDGLAPSRVLAIAEAARKGWPLGDPAFVAALAQQAARPLQARPRGRPARDLQSRSVPRTD